MLNYFNGTSSEYIAKYALNHLNKFYIVPGTLTPLLKQLENKGYILRKRNICDERNIITITKEGTKLKEKAEDIPKKMSCNFNLKNNEINTLYETLYKTK